MIEDGELERRACIAYFRRFGQNAPQPSIDVGPEYVELYNVNGHLACYRIVERPSGAIALKYVDKE